MDEEYQSFDAACAHQQQDEARSLEADQAARLADTRYRETHAQLQEDIAAYLAWANYMDAMLDLTAGRPLPQRLAA